MLQLSFVGVITGRYVDFTTAQHAALRMVAERMGRELSDEDAERIVGGMQRLPPHPEVPGAIATAARRRVPPGHDHQLAAGGRQARS